MMGAMLPLILKGNHHIGWMERKIWAEMGNTLLRFELIQNALPVDQAFDLRPLQQVYGATG